MGLYELYDFYWNEKADPRTNNLPLMGSPVLIPFILISYLYIVLKLGPEYMKDRKPYDLKTFVKGYNIFQIVANAYFVQQFLSVGWLSQVTTFCYLPDYSYEPGPLKMAYTLWLVTMVKLLDLVETFVFVLRKKNEQVSVLHTYHHVSTVLLIWLITRYIPVALVSFTVVVNCGVHVIMYTYYLLSSCGDNMQKAISMYKPLLTITQMVQFVIIMVQILHTLLPSCHVPRLPAIVTLLNVAINFYLFYNFYQRRYTKTK
ncbi:very long chain fatty acid elongase 1 [Xylocopa sonorina]|uniref:very long chain fatty acid elongase 1 n=1 Tax=Xylocopa sonorina TaxID=1818115 RepID=UPI00403AF879